MKLLQTEFNKLENSWRQDAPVGLKKDGLTEELRRRYEAARSAYLGGESISIEDVESLYRIYARSTDEKRRQFYSRQLVGNRLFNTDNRPSQREIHLEFKKLQRGGESAEQSKLSRKIKKSVTPQISPSEDQLEKFKVYFGEEVFERYISTRIYILGIKDASGSNNSSSQSNRN